MMPVRRRTRAQDQAQQIAYERALNEAELREIAAAQEAAARRREELQAVREAGRRADETTASGEQHTPTENDIPPPS